MGIVSGTVEVVSHKWDKVSVLVNEQWYSTKEEFYKEQNGPPLNKGDVITFQSGSTGKFLQNVKITGGGGGDEAAPDSGTSKPAQRKYVDNTIGMAVGAAMNQSVSIFSAGIQGDGPRALSDDALSTIESNAQQLFLVAEGLKENATAGDINVGKEEREAGAKAMEILNAEFAD